MNSTTLAPEVTPASLVGKLIAFDLLLTMKTKDGGDLYRKQRMIVEAIREDEDTTYLVGVWIDGLEPMSIPFYECRNIEVSEDSEDWSVYRIETPESWYPGEPLPDTFYVTREYLEGVSLPMASAIADAGNRFNAMSGERGKWYIAAPAGLEE